MFLQDLSKFKTLDFTLFSLYTQIMDMSANYNLNNDQQIDRLATALSSSVRRKMLRLLGENSYSVLELASVLNLSVSTTSFHLKFLKEACLVQVVSNPNKRGNEKIITQGLASVNLNFQAPLHYKQAEFIYNVPIGSYTSYNVKAPCGLINEQGLLYMHDNPNVFRAPERLSAILLSFSRGYVEYSIPAFEYKDKTILSFTFSLELCSECPNYNNSWKSDITFWINGKEVCTYRSLGDYGDRRGLFPIPNWPANSTQYGMLKKIRIDNTGTFIDESPVSGVTIDDLNLCAEDITTLRIGIKENARYIGGINLFGKNSGDTEQDIVVQVCYKTQ